MRMKWTITLLMNGDKKMGDLVKVFTEMFWSDESDIGFIKFVVTFVLIFVGIKAIIYFIEGEK